MAVMLGPVERSGRQPDDRPSVQFQPPILCNFTPPLTIVRFHAVADENGSSLVVACIVPMGAVATQSLKVLISRVPAANWKPILLRITAAPVVSDEPLEVALGRVLREKTFPRVRLQRSHTTSVGGGSRRSQLLPRVISATLLPAADTYGPIPVLGPVIVTATSTSWVVDTQSLWNTLSRYFNFGENIDWLTYSEGPDCPAAQAEYDAQLAQADRMQDVANILDELAGEAERAQYLCKPTNGKRVCIDFFIQSDRALVFGGDARTFDPDAGYRASRVQLYLNPDTQTWEVKFNGSIRWTLNGISVAFDSARVFRPDQDVKVTGSTDTLKLELQFANNYCLSSRVGCPMINAIVWLYKDTSKPGGYNVYWDRDGFPSMGVYSRKADDTGWDTMAEDPEMIRNAWLNWTALISGIRSSAHLPPGCYFQ